ncbi:hypothetical protein SASPL_149244 [Salvia splendens]|uniref:Uncharacterized protein n=1 Tax=Salvia splendens TaxID=180675 RepID=A0A8X8WBU5_SALSN|nr:hypothetical protein SASPL_149244 [Salvia splendens]
MAALRWREMEEGLLLVGERGRRWKEIGEEVKRLGYIAAPTVAVTLIILLARDCLIDYGRPFRGTRSFQRRHSHFSCWDHWLQFSCMIRGAVAMDISMWLNVAMLEWIWTMQVAKVRERLCEEEESLFGDRAHETIKFKIS